MADRYSKVAKNALFLRYTTEGITITKSDQMPPSKKTLYPTLDTEGQVLEEGCAQLPITSRNDLAALLATHKNTVLQEQENDEVSPSDARRELDGTPGS